MPSPVSPSRSAFPLRRLLFSAALLWSGGAVAQTAPTLPPPSEPVPLAHKLEGNWTELRGLLKEQWGRLTDDDLLTIEGAREQLQGRIQYRYGLSAEEAEKQVGEFEKAKWPKKK